MDDSWHKKFLESKIVVFFGKMSAIFTKHKYFHFFWQTILLYRTHQKRNSTTFCSENIFTCGPGLLWGSVNMFNVTGKFWWSVPAVLKIVLTVTTVTFSVFLNLAPRFRVMEPLDRPGLNLRLIRQRLFRWRWPWPRDQSTHFDGYNKTRIQYYLMRIESIWERSFVIETLS